MVISAGPHLRVAKHGHKLGRFHMAVEEVVSAPLDGIQCLLKLTHLDRSYHGITGFATAKHT